MTTLVILERFQHLLAAYQGRIARRPFLLAHRRFSLVFNYFGDALRNSRVTVGAQDQVMQHAHRPVWHLLHDEQLMTGFRLVKAGVASD